MAAKVEERALGVGGSQELETLETELCGQSKGTPPRLFRFLVSIQENPRIMTRATIRQHCAT